MKPCVTCKTLGEGGVGTILSKCDLSLTAVGPSSAPALQPLPGLVWVCESRRDAPDPVPSLPGWPGKTDTGSLICHVAGSPHGRSPCAGASHGPRLHCSLEKPHAVGPGRQAAEEGPGPAGLYGMASGPGPAL